MDKVRRILRSPITTVVLFVLAAALLLSGAIGGSRAALSYYADSYYVQMAMQNIGVTLNENGTAVCWRNYSSDSSGQWVTSDSGLLTGMLGADESLRLGYAYPELLTVTNSGNINEYVRVSIYRYWVDGSGAKQQELDPSLIELGLTNSGSWRVDEAASTEERIVLYYTRALSPGETTPAFMDTLTISADTAARVTQTSTETMENGRMYNTVRTVYDYDGKEFQLEVEVDAVQTHNGAAAIQSAWGVNASSVGLG